MGRPRLLTNCFKIGLTALHVSHIPGVIRLNESKWVISLIPLCAASASSLHLSAASSYSARLLLNEDPVLVFNLYQDKCILGKSAVIMGVEVEHAADTRKVGDFLQLVSDC